MLEVRGLGCVGKAERGRKPVYEREIGETRDIRVKERQ